MSNFHDFSSINDIQTFNQIISSGSKEQNILSSTAFGREFVLKDDNNNYYHVKMNQILEKFNSLKNDDPISDTVHDNIVKLDYKGEKEFATHGLISKVWRGISHFLMIMSENLIQLNLLKILRKIALLLLQNLK